MGFKKIEVLLLILLLFLLLFLLDAATAKDFVGEPNGRDKEMTAKLNGSKQVVSVGRKGGGTGGHGGGGHGIGGSHGRGSGAGSRGAGDAGEARGSGNANRGPNLIPFYAAGALPHRQDNQHRSGSNHGNLNAVDPPSFLLVLFLVVYLFNVFHS